MLILHDKLSVKSGRLGAPAVLLLAALALAGCSGRPEGVLIPQVEGANGEVAGATSVDMLVATTRSGEGAKPGEMFSGERGVGLNFADLKISIPPDNVRQLGEVQWPARLPANPSREFVTLSAQRLDQAAALKTFYSRLNSTPHRRVLVFVHGYNTRFEEAVYRFAQIVHDSRAPALPVLFTWPSRGRLLEYAYDRESANYSRDALESILQTMAKDKAVGEISILAHSMGNWVTLEALRQMSIRNGALSPKIKSVMLAAPDVDVDVFRRQIREISAQNAPFTLFVSRDDKALALSQRLWGNTPRVGAVDPNQEPYRSRFAREKLKVIDLTALKSGDSLNHGKFAESPQLVQMIGGRLAAGQALSDNQAGLGERVGMIASGAAATAGRAASIAVSAPIAVVDGRTRAGLGDQMRDFGAQIGNTAGATTGAVSGR